MLFQVQILAMYHHCQRPTKMVYRLKITRNRRHCRIIGTMDTGQRRRRGNMASGILNFRAPLNIRVPP